MMAEKARLFNDEETLQLILASSDPGEQKALGRRVQNFNQEAWTSNCQDIVYRGNLAKFSQNESLKAYLLSFEDRKFAEAASFDTVWGIGLSADDERALDESTWAGQNLLGTAITRVRDALKET